MESHVDNKNWQRAMDQFWSFREGEMSSDTWQMSSFLQCHFGRITNFLFNHLLIFVVLPKFFFQVGVLY